MGCSPPARGGLSPPHSLSLQGEGQTGINHTSPKSLLDWPPPVSISAPEPSASCTAQAVTSARVGRSLPYSSISPPGPPPTPEGTQIRASPLPLRTSLVPKPWHCASYLPRPEIMTQHGKLRSLFRVWPKSQSSHSEGVLPPESFLDITDSMIPALNCMGDMSGSHRRAPHVAPQSCSLTQKEHASWVWIK